MEFAVWVVKHAKPHQLMAMAPTVLQVRIYVHLPVCVGVVCTLLLPFVSVDVVSPTV